jgi:alkylhydroperoxidase family enzyme
MAWISTKSMAEAEGELAELFAEAGDPDTGELDNIMAIHSAHPAGLAAHIALYTAVMRGTASLRKVERELIAFVVSQENGCHY